MINVEKWKGLIMIQAIQPHLMGWACRAANGTGSHVIFGDVTADKSSMRNSEVYGAILLAQIQPYASKPTELHAAVEQQ